uniref:Secreted protein n=1 Tax=Panagrellus redivivus TaxID=6233 RepID=A0A7E4V6F4_PANRE
MRLSIRLRFIAKTADVAAEEAAAAEPVDLAVVVVAELAAPVVEATTAAADTATVAVMEAAMVADTTESTCIYDYV